MQIPHQVNEQGDAPSQNVPTVSYMSNTTSFEDTAKRNASSWSSTTKVEEICTLGFWSDAVSDADSTQKQPFQSFQVYEDTKVRDDTMKPEHTPQKVTIRTPLSEQKPLQDSKPQSFTGGSRIAQQIFGDDSDNSPNNFAASQKTPNQYLRLDKKALQITPNNFVVPNTTPKTSGTRQFLSQPEHQTSREQLRQLSQPPIFAQPEPRKNANELFHIFDDARPLSANLNETTCNTEVFNFNLHVASTPFNHKKFVAQQYANEMKNEDHESKPCKQKLFEEKATEDMYPIQQNREKLSVILESTKELCCSSGSSSGGGTTLKNTFSGYSLKTIPENISIERTSHSQSKIYVQNPNQINQHESYQRSPQNDTLQVLGIKSPGTPSPQKNLTLTVPYNTTGNQSRMSYSAAIVREEPSPMQMKRPQFPNDQSYIMEDINATNNGESPNKMLFTDANSPYQTQQYYVKQRERKIDRERFQSKNHEGKINYTFG